MKLAALEQEKQLLIGMELESQSVINLHHKLHPIKPNQLYQYLGLNLLRLHLPLGQAWNVLC